MTQVTKNQKTAKRFNFPSTLLGKLTRNTCFLLLLICIIMFLLYLIGNFQMFTDKTQLKILSVLSISASALSVMSVLAFIQEIVLIFLKKKKTGSVLSILLYIFTFVTGGALTAISTIIKRIASGI